MAALKKVVYFTLSDVPTAGEIADIAKLNAATAAPYEVAVRSSVRPMSSGGDNEACDYVAGTIPEVEFYEEKDVIDPDDIPNQNLSATQVIVNDGDELAAVGGGTIAVAVAAGVATYTYTAP